MTVESQPKEGQQVEVWTRDGKKIMEGVIGNVSIRPVNGKPAEITIRDDVNVSDAK